MKRSTSAHDVGVAQSTMDCTSRGSTDTPVSDWESMAEQAEPRPPKFALGTLSEKLAPAEGLERLRDVEQVLLFGEWTRQSSVYTPTRTAPAGPTPQACRR